MRIPGLDFDCTPLAGAAPCARARVDAAQWRAAFVHAQALAADGGARLIALWATPDGIGTGTSAGGTIGGTVHGALELGAQLLWLSLPVAAGATYPGIDDLFPGADRMQRGAADLTGIRSDAPTAVRPWLRHGAWPADHFPLRVDFARDARFPATPDDYPFVRVEGDGVHEIPVGPVHAGTIEPGHFRFSILGERVLRLEQRLGYKHKGIEKLFAGMGVDQGARLAGRISGDSTVAFAWAYAMAIEAAAGITPPERALWLRALLLERERIANHLGDLGFLGNDAGFAFGLQQFSLLKENLLRTNAEVLGHRYAMDLVVPGGVVRDVPQAAYTRLIRESDAIETALIGLHRIFDDHPGLQDRFQTTGRATPELAARLGLCGMAGRASGQAFDLRATSPCVPYDRLEVRMAGSRQGDVAARVNLRFDEILESLRLSRLILERMPAGDLATPVPALRESAEGLGRSEGWRGESLIALEAGAGGTLARVHAHDPSWQNWPVLEHAIIGNIVPDFPLINKSFNLSYSGQDL